MTEVLHINCGTLRVPSYPTVVCHCLALCERDEVVLVDTGIGLADVRDPVGRLGQPLIDAAGFQFNERDTAVMRVEARGFKREQVRNIILTHADPDHVGGLADFPAAQVHVSAAEFRQLQSGDARYVAAQFAHSPRWRTYGGTNSLTDWFGLTARRVDVPLSAPVYLVELPGHTHGHCGVAIAQGDRWFLHVGDAYYLRAELENPEHPVGQMATARASDDSERRASVDHLRRIATKYAARVAMCGYHDITELPRECIDWE